MRSFLTRQQSELVGLFVKEGRRHLMTLVTMFSVIAILALAIEIALPKRWDATAVVVVESTNILKPLMEGRAVTTAVADQTAFVTQVVLSKRVLREIVAFGGLAKKKMDAIQEQVLLEQLKSRIKIDSLREEAIKISYHDNEPKRTAQITNKVAELYVREASNLKENDSREAFEFISEQVKVYEKRLNDDHAKLLAYYRGQLQAQNTPAPAPTDAPSEAAPPAHTESKAKLSPDDLAELRTEEATLTTQLGHKKAVASPETLQAEEQQYRGRVLQLQGELDRLLVTYTDEHPDVKRARRDLAIAKDELNRTEQARRDRESERARAEAADDEETRAARERLEVVRAKIASATGTPGRRRLSTSPRPRAVAAADPNSIDGEMRGVSQDTVLSELLRRYEATRDVYQDFLKRRENARVSMELDAQHRGLTMRIEEMAEVPVLATGLRLAQLSLIGLLVAVAIPFGFLFAIVRLDPRVRSATQIERLANLPLLITIPQGPGTRVPLRRQGGIAGLMVAGVFVIYVAAFIVRLKLTSAS
jgi:polysaccharide chain length determinant protein (PEP-CTERM system associated)